MDSIPLDFTETAPVENNKYGEKMQFDASGPYQKTRSKTDFCWLIGFIVFLAIWITVVIYAFSVGDTSDDKWRKPKDSAGRICGYDSSVQDKPYLVQYNIGCRDCLVCQTDCPTSDFNFDDYAERRVKQSGDKVEEAKPYDVAGEKNNGTLRAEKIPAENETRTDNDKENKSPNRMQEEQSDSNGDPGSNKETPTTTMMTMMTMTTTTTTTTTTAMTTTTTAPTTTTATTSKIKLSDIIKKVICKSEVNLDSINSWDELTYLVDNGKCSRTYKKTDDRKYENRCGFNLTDSDEDSEKSRVATVFAATQDLSNAKWSIMGFIMLSGTMALAIIFLMRWHAMMYVCISIFVICAVIFQYIYEKCVLNAESKTNGILLALFLGVVVLVAIVLIAIYFRKQLSLACQMIKESTKAITCVLSSLVVPFLFFVIYMIIFILGVSTYFLLSSLESPVHRIDLAPANLEKCECPPSVGYSQDSICDPITFASECRKTSDGAGSGPCTLSRCYMVEQAERNVGFLQFINIVGLIWIFWFVTGFNDIVLASVFSTWYWTLNKKILSYLSTIESFWRISTYHLGTVALGSLLILICTIIREICRAVERTLKKSNKPCAAAILLCLRCLFDVLEKGVDFIDRRAYIMCAMHGTDFFHSARTAYYLLKRNAGRVIAVVTVTNCITFITNVLIACITTQISISYYDAYRADDFTSRKMPVLLIFMGSYAICCMLMRVVEVAVDTVFICFLEDTERNDGTNDRPYFMSEELTKFLYKK